MEYYIKKNDAVSLLMKEAKSHDLSFSAEAYERAANLTACLPNEDVQPVKHGRWESPASVGNGIKFCSVCRNEAYWDMDYGQQLFDYCPYCGARMGGDTNE